MAQACAAACMVVLGAMHIMLQRTALALAGSMRVVLLNACYTDKATLLRGGLSTHSTHSTRKSFRGSP